MVDGRIHALARAHNQITDDHWGPAPIQALIDAEAAAFVSGGADRVRSRGEPVMLNPQAYSTMALVIHELVTNSTKYGSLSEDGYVDCSWERSDAGDLLFTWCEKDGPAVTPPTRKGFGTTIIDRSVPYDLGGSAQIDYKPEGVEAQFRIPARHVSSPTRSVQTAERFPRPAPGHPVEAPSNLLNGRTVLLVEDSLIIALDAEDIVTRLGAATVNTAATVEAALDCIKESKPDIAMLDINLGDRNSFAVAERLVEIGVPFFFATGYGEQAQLPDAQRGHVVVQKPYTIENVARAMHELTTGQL
jgi:CheY-like chemotaxis protein